VAARRSHDAKQPTRRTATAPAKKARAARSASLGPAAPAASRPAGPAAAAPAPAPPADVAPEIAAELAHAAADPAQRAAQWRNASAVAGVLQEIATLLQLGNANSFKVRAYESAARTLAGVGEDLGELLESGGLDELPGIGTSIAEKIAVLVRTGHLPYLDELRAQVPAGILDMMRIPGLGPKKARALHEGLGIRSIDELDAACRAGRLEGLRGFGEKTEQNILLGIEQLRSTRGTFLWSTAHAAAAPVMAALRAHAAVRQCETAGSLRRRKETVHDVDIVVATDDAPAVMQAFARGPWAARLLGSGETKTSIVDHQGLQMDLRAVTPAQYPYALHHFTGSKEHNIAMRGRAQRMGIKMNEYGLFRGETLIPCRDEAEIFAAVGLAYVPPEMREDRGEIETAETGELPARLVEASDIRGAFHLHTTAGAGRDTLEAMVRAARDRGWGWVGVADHGPGIAWTRGLDAARLATQRRAIERVQAAVPEVRVFHGIECDLAADGSLDLDAAALARLDFVIAAVHGALHLGRDEQTRRLVRAVENPLVTILGHPTGRILLHRPGCEADWPAVFAAAARAGVLVEIDAHPQRMDVNGTLAYTAREQGAMLCIGLDAHDVAGLGHIEYGLGMARRGWLEPVHLIDTRSAAEVDAHLRRRRQGSRPA
jgi:DNA polymerase (family 10)